MITVPQEVWKGLEAVRRSGVVNMLDRSGVVHWANQLGFAETAEWILENPKTYTEGVFNGFQVES